MPRPRLPAAALLALLGLSCATERATAARPAEPEPRAASLARRDEPLHRPGGPFDVRALRDWEQPTDAGVRSHDMSHPGRIPGSFQSFTPTSRPP